MISFIIDQSADDFFLIVEKCIQHSFLFTFPFYILQPTDNKEQ